MIRSKQQTLFWYFSGDSIITPISDLLRRGLKELAYLCCPEDTTDNIGRLQSVTTHSEAIGVRHLLKGVFWVIVSIAVPLAVGQLL